GMGVGGLGMTKAAGAMAGLAPVSEQAASKAVRLLMTPAEKKYFTEMIKPQYELLDEVPSLKMRGNAIEFDKEHAGQFLNWMDESLTHRDVGERLPPSFY